MKSRAIALALAALLVVAVPASANRRPKSSEVTGLISTLAEKGLTCAQYPAGTCQIHFRISTVNSRWASAKVRPDVNGENTVKPLDVGVRRPHRKGGAWAVKSIGNGGGCNVPKRPRHDLGLICLAIGPGQ
ncbi:MAG: hypothetical protein QOD60_1204 [Solirubrobacterales bacterium]|nr:hypothetical protein [Solirubrobacterales bacterium]